MADGRTIVKTIEARQGLLENRKSRWDDLLEDIAENLYPMREDIKGTAQSGERQGQEIYDGAGIEALNILSNGIYGNMLSPAIRWFQYLLQDEKLNKNHAVREWLQEVERHMYLQYGRSNFYDEAHTLIKDGAGMGTGTIYPYEDIENDGFNFTTIHPGEVFLGMSDKERHDLIHRKFDMEARQLKMKFGKIPHSIEMLLKTDPFKESEVIHAVFPNESYDPAHLNASRKKFASIWTVATGRNEEDRLLRTSGFDRYPYVHWLYERTGNEEYGRCPGMYALADMMGLNLMSKHLLGAAERAVEPPFAVPEEMEDQLNLMPRGIQYYTDPKAIPFALDTSAQFPIGIDREERKTQAIRAHFHVDFFLMLAAAERGLTATEVLERQGEKASVLSPMIGRISRTFDEIHDLTFDIEFRAGRIAPPPKELIESGLRSLDVVYQGPLAQVQRRLFQTVGITRALESVIPYMDIAPEIRHIFKWSDVARDLAESQGMPQKNINTEEEVEELVAQEQIQQQRQAAMAEMESAAKSTKDLAAADQLSGGQLAEAGQEIFGGE